MTILYSNCGDTTTRLYRATANNPPCQHCDGAPCGPCSELADIETQIETLHSRLRDLHEKHRAARSKRNIIHSRLIHQLPPEIVSHIFSLCLSPRPSNCFVFRSDGFPFTISAVCRAWRACGLSTPSLWSNPISVDVNKPYVAHLNHRLMYSGSLPVSIRLHSTRRAIPNTDDSIGSTEVMSLIKKNLHRTHYLCLCLSGEHIKKFSSISNGSSSAPLLQELHVHCPDVRGSSELKLSTTLPRPRTVHVSYHANFIHLDWDNVSNLTLKETTIHCSLVLLSKAKRLVNFTLHINGEISRPSSPDTPIVHQSIRHLTLSGVEAADTIFSCSTMTSLDTLFISKLTEFFDIYQGFATFLRRSSCPLRCLEISFANRFTGDTLINVLSEIPTLQELSLIDNYDVADEAEAIGSLLERLSLTQSSGNGIFLPHLRSFEYEGVPVPSYTLLLGIFPVDPPPSGGLQKVGVKIWAHPDNPNWPWPPFISKDDIQRILRLREAAKHISITVHIWESEDPFDFVQRSMEA